MEVIKNMPFDEKLKNYAAEIYCVFVILHSANVSTIIVSIDDSVDTSIDKRVANKGELMNINGKVSKFRILVGFLLLTRTTTNAMQKYKAGTFVCFLSDIYNRNEKVFKQGLSISLAT